MLLLGVPFIIIVPEILDRMLGASYYFVNTAVMLIVVFLIWQLTDILPGIQRDGCYWKENGRTILAYEGCTETLDSVTEIFLSDRHAFSRGINLLIRNRGKKIEFLSEALDADTNMECTAFYPLCAQILAENPQLTAEEDVFGEKTDYWYKKKE